jgi:TPR repeat protein
MVPCIFKIADRTACVPVVAAMGNQGFARRMQIGIRRFIVSAVLLASVAGRAAAQSEVQGIVEVLGPTSQRLETSKNENEDPAPIFTLGVMFDEGQGVAINEQLAYQCYTWAAARGHSESMNRLGLLYVKGRGVPQDYVAAIGWFARAAALGSVSAVDNIATLYFYGLGVPQSYSSAAQLLTAAASKGDAAAQNKLGVLQDVGLGLPPDHRAARELFRRSAAQGYPPGMVNLGRMYTEGIGGEKDAVRGYALLRAAIDRGVPSSMATVALDELDAAAAQLDTRQRKTAQLMAIRLSTDGPMRAVSASALLTGPQT